MTNRLLRSLPFLSPILVSACAPLPPQPTVVELTAHEARGYAFARALCAPCHAITANGSSPNPEAPPFEAVVNTKGVTSRTLEAFLRDSHNFPGAMAFTIDPRKVHEVTTYMLTLKRADYKPAL